VRGRAWWGTVVLALKVIGAGDVGVDMDGSWMEGGVLVVATKGVVELAVGVLRRATGKGSIIKHTKSDRETEAVQ
jgi:hypothetical protein